MQCLNCNDIITLDLISQHECFIQENVNENFFEQVNYNESDSLCAEKKEPAIWNQNATLALLSLYETKIDMLDHPKKKGKIWEAVSTALQKDFDIQMSVDQVRWKMNSLIKKYKECVDNNLKSGRSLMTFKWFDQMDEIFNKGKDATVNHVFSSKCTNAKPSTSSTKEVYSKSSTSTLVPCNTSDTKSSCSEDSSVSKSIGSTLNTKSQNKRLPRGTNSNIARDKVKLENQRLEYVKMKIEHDKACDERHVSASEHRKEVLKMKKKYYAAKEEEIKQRKQYLTTKLQEKAKRHTEIVAIEEKKYKLLKKIVKANSSDSD